MTTERRRGRPAFPDQLTPAEWRIAHDAGLRGQSPVEVRDGSVVDRAGELDQIRMVGSDNEVPKPFVGYSRPRREHDPEQGHDRQS